MTVILIPHFYEEKETFHYATYIKYSEFLYFFFFSILIRNMQSIVLEAMALSFTVCVYEKV